MESDNNPDVVNKVIRDNINLRMPEEGEKVHKMVEIAKLKNIDYKPSAECAAALAMYADRIGGGAAPPIPEPMPMYNPSALSDIPPGAQVTITTTTN